MSRNEHKKKEGTVITNCSVTENVPLDILMQINRQIIFHDAKRDKNHYLVYKGLISLSPIVL